MSIEKVREVFRKNGIEDKIIEFDVSSATVEKAALALGCKEQEIAKSMSFKIDEQPIIVVMAGDARVDNSKYKSEFGKKAKMLSPDELPVLIGHKMGGVCPFAICDNVKVYLDVSLKRFEYVYPAAGSANSAVKLSIEELEKYSNYISWVDVSKIVE